MRFHILLTAALFWSCLGCRPTCPTTLSWQRLVLSWKPPLHHLHPCSQAFMWLWGKCLGLRSTCLLQHHSVREHRVGWEWRWGWDGMAGKNLSCPVGSLWNPACGRDHPSVSILFRSIGKHIVLNTHSLSFPFSASALCACALRLVSRCLDPPGLLVRVRC